MYILVGNYTSKNMRGFLTNMLKPYLIIETSGFSIESNGFNID